MSLSSASEVMLKPHEFLAKAVFSKVMSVDTETNGHDIRDGRGYCVGISAAINENGIYYHSYFPVAHYQDNISDETKSNLYDLIATRIIPFHNAKFDLESLRTAGYPGKFHKWYCTMMMAHFLNENVPSLSLDWLSKNELKNPGKVKKDYKGIWAMGLGNMIPVAEIELYAGIDTVRTLQLFERLHPYFVKAGFDGDPMQEV
ncbi:3'-5' exonuclease family protein [Streptomyces rochei]|uniref:hypothetical protein n=1 Tax=Streptomyces rochei TaxID=1928 RepID=UPI0036A28E4A